MSGTASHTAGNLIAAEKVNGTSVFNQADETPGGVDDIMIDKISGRAIYAVMAFAGFLGMGEKYHPLPWAALKYDTSKGGYVVNIDTNQLEGAPNYDRGSDIEWTPDYGRQVNASYQRSNLLDVTARTKLEERPSPSI